MDVGRRQSSVALTGSASRANPLRRAFQAALGALSWIGFALLWVWQLEVYVPSTWMYSICLIAIILAAWIVFTIAWVKWNRNIYARRHRRTTPVRMEVEMAEDSLGRPIVASGGIRAAEGQIFIDVDESDRKRYYRPRKRVPSVRELLPPWPGTPATAAAAAAEAAEAGAAGAGAAAAPAAPSASANGNGNAHNPHSGRVVVDMAQQVAPNGGGGAGGADEVRERVRSLAR